METFVQWKEKRYDISHYTRITHNSFVGANVTFSGGNKEVYISVRKTNFLFLSSYKMNLSFEFGNLFHTTFHLFILLRFRFHLFFFLYYILSQ